jgi:hypothetical protein
MKIYYICASTNSYSIWYDVILLAIATKEKRENEKRKRMFYTSGDTPLALLCCFRLPIVKVRRMILWLNIPRDKNKYDQDM